MILHNLNESIVEDAALRDTQLPKPISGDLRVKGAVRTVGMAG